MSGFVCPECGKEINIFKKGGAEKMAKEMEVDFLGSIPMEAIIVEAGDTGRPYISTDSIASRKLDAIISRVIEKVEK